MGAEGWGWCHALLRWPSEPLICFFGKGHRGLEVVAAGLDTICCDMLKATDIENVMVDGLLQRHMENKACLVAGNLWGSLHVVFVLSLHVTTFPRILERRLWLIVKTPIKEELCGSCLGCCYFQSYWLSW